MYVHQHLEEEEAVNSQHAGCGANNPHLEGPDQSIIPGPVPLGQEDVASKTLPSGKCSGHHCYSCSGVTKRSIITFVGFTCIWAIAGYRRQPDMVPSTFRKGCQPGFCFVMAYTLYLGYDGTLWVSLSPLSGSLEASTFLKQIAACASANNTECCKRCTCEGRRRKQLLGTVAAW